MEHLVTSIENYVINYIQTRFTGKQEDSKIKQLEIENLKQSAKKRKIQSLIQRKVIYWSENDESTYQ